VEKKTRARIDGWALASQKAIKLGQTEREHASREVLQTALVL
jgi:hypothetical protein